MSLKFPCFINLVVGFSISLASLLAAQAQTAATPAATATLRGHIADHLSQLGHAAVFSCIRENV